MSLLPVGISGEEAGYQIERSVRLNSSDSAYFSRTPASAGNRKTWTWSGWVKRSALPASGYYSLFGADSGSGASFYFAFDNSTQQIEFGQGATVYRKTTQVFRDPSAWYHVFLSLDTTQATANDRVKIYINGAQVTAFGTTNNPTQNADLAWNSNVAHSIGADIPNTGARNYFNGYLTEINFIDGSALDPTSFGEYNTDTGVWQPKAYTGSYGTNGFYLNFSDNSGVTSTTLGADSSGNGNNWTPNNFSVTAGAGNDSLVDTPTPYGTDTGVGGEVRGNYCTLNPLAVAVTSSISTFTNGNLDITTATSGQSATFATIALPSSGKWYWEITATGGTAGWYIGVAVFAVGANYFTGNTALFYANDGNKYINSTSSAYGATYTTNDIIGIAANVDSGTVTFYKNGVSQGAITYASGEMLPFVLDGSSSATSSYTANFGQRPFAYTAPSGFKALCTQNLPEPTIVDGGEYFNTVLYTGNGATYPSSQSITGLQFQPDFTWIKSRSNAYPNFAFDAVRGAGKELVINDTASETNKNQLSAFNSNGFSVAVATDGSLGTNGNGSTFVAWNWKANGAGVSNTAGTITSTVSANTDSGFSIVKFDYTGATGVNTVGHGLGVAPSMLIVKPLTTFIWDVWHKNLSSNNNYLVLNATDAQATNSQVWNGTAPSSTVFTLGDAWDDYGFSNIIAYVFAAIPGYSAFGSYTGNGSADGPFVYTGFRPKFIMQKKTSATGEWVIWDTSRSPYNFAGPFLYANSSAAEGASAEYLDILSNGFKWRTTNSTLNQSGATSIFMAFAENPFKYSLAR